MIMRVLNFSRFAALCSSDLASVPHRLQPRCGTVAMRRCPSSCSRSISSCSCCGCGSAYYGYYAAATPMPYYAGYGYADAEVDVLYAARAMGVATGVARRATGAARRGVGRY